MPDFFLNESDATLRLVHFTCVKDDDVNDRLTDAELGSFTLSLKKPGVAAASPSGTTVTESDAATQPGVWTLALNAADLDTPGDSVLVITNAGGSKIMRPREIRIRVKRRSPFIEHLPVDAVKHLGTAYVTPTTAGVPRVDVKAMEANVLTATAINAAAFTEPKFGAGAFTLAKFAADVLLGAFGILDSGTATAGSTTQITLRVGASAVVGAYVGATLFATGGSGALQQATIATYNESTKVATFSAAVGTAFSATTTYVILPAGGASGSAPSAAVVAAAVWDAISENATSYGKQWRGVVATLYGKVRNFATGSLAFRDQADTKDRLTGLVDSTGRIARTIVDLDP